MKKIILFRFYKDPEVCANRLELIRHFNPDIDVFGLYGGDEEDFKEFNSRLKDKCENIYCIRNKDAGWKWLHGDLAARMWYRDYGRQIPFDMLYSNEWDLLQFDSIKNIYQGITKSHVGLTAPVPLEEIWGRWWWTVKESWWIDEWKKLLDYVKLKYNYEGIPHASYGPGACFSKQFLDNYSDNEVPELCHEEIRLPIFAQVLGFELRNNNFRKKWFDPEEGKYFHCDKRDIKDDIIVNELMNKNGRRIFHPYRKIIDLEKILINKNTGK